MLGVWFVTQLFQCIIIVMVSLIPENNIDDMLVINLVGLSEEDLDVDYGGVVPALDSIRNFIEGLFAGVPSLSLEILESYKNNPVVYSSCKYTGTKSNYLGDENMLIDQSLIGGTEITIGFKTDGGDTYIPVLVGASSIVVNKKERTFTVTTGLESLGEKLTTAVVHY